MPNEAKMDEETKLINVTELVTCGDEQGLGVLSRGAGKKRLKEVVIEGEDPTESDLCGTTSLRERTTYFIRKYRRQITLPPSVGGGPCSGDCRTYGCPTIVAINCSRNMSK